MFKILVVEDDENTRKLMSAILKRHRFEVLLADNGVSALDVMDREHVDLVIVDIMMPKMDGYELTHLLRQSYRTLPILMVTARQEVVDKRKGFLAGTDDYMTKPVDGEEMILRIKALLRRAQIAGDRKLIIRDVILDYDALSVTHGNEKVTIPQKEFQLLFKLLSYPDIIFTRLQLMDEIWGMDTETDDHTLNVHIGRLRERFRDWDEFEIVTVRGLGYKALTR